MTPKLQYHFSEKRSKIKVTRQKK